MTEDLKDHDGLGSDEIEAPNPAAAAELAKEVRFGLSLLGLLLALLATALYVKLGSPGFPWGGAEVAQADSAAPAEEPQADAASAGPAGEPAAQPIHLAAQPDATARTPLWNDNRYAEQQEPAMPAEAPPTGGAAEESHEAAGAEQPVNPFDHQAQTPEQDAAAQLPADEAPPFAAMPAGGDHADQPIETTAATEATPFDAVPAEPFSASELPAEPPQNGGPLIAESEAGVELQPHPDAGPSIVQPAGAKEPTLAEPRNSPYGRGQVRDRYAAGGRTAPPPLPGEDGPRAAPSAEHTPLHAVPDHDWNAAGAAPAPHESELERELQEQRTPQHGRTPPPSGAMNDLDAPASEFAAPRDDIMSHHHQPTHTPTADGTYTVEPNDSFWTISQKVYGTGGYFKAVQRHNRKPGNQADGLEIGEKILVPPVETLQQKYPDLCPKQRGAGTGRMMPASAHGNLRGGRVYVVEEGDTLFDIARYELGKASRWAEIYDLNRGQLGTDYNYIAPGTKLMLPDAVTSEPDALTTRPGTPFPR
jgi:nucleoid-associated protein YgaU